MTVPSAALRMAGSLRGWKGLGDREVEYDYRRLMENRAAHNKLLRECGYEELLEEEAIGARLLTGPMIMKYNLALYSSAAPPRLKEAAQQCNRGNSYRTTIHVVNSAIVKLSKLTRVQLVCRELPTTKLPASFYRPSRSSGVCGGAEVGFMWARAAGRASSSSARESRARTFDASELLLPASRENERGRPEGGIRRGEGECVRRLELQMTHDERGARLSEFSQLGASYDAQTYFFAPLVVMEVQELHWSPAAEGRDHISPSYGANMSTPAGGASGARSKLVVRAQLSTDRNSSISAIVQRRKRMVLELVRSFADTMQASIASSSEWDKLERLTSHERGGRRLSAVAAKQTAMKTIRDYARTLEAIDPDLYRCAHIPGATDTIPNPSRNLSAHSLMVCHAESLPDSLSRDQLIGEKIQEAADLLKLVQRWPAMLERLLVELARYGRLSASIPLMECRSEGDGAEGGGGDNDQGEAEDGEHDALRYATLASVNLSQLPSSPVGSHWQSSSSRARTGSSLLGGRKSASRNATAKASRMAKAATVVSALERWRKSSRLHAELLQMECLDLCESRAEMRKTMSRDEQLQLQRDLTEGAMALLCLCDTLQVLHLEGIEIDELRARALAAGLQDRAYTEVHIGFNAMGAPEAERLALKLCELHTEECLSLYDSQGRDLFASCRITPSMIATYRRQRKTLEHLKEMVDRYVKVLNPSRSLAGLLSSKTLMSDPSRASASSTTGMEGAHAEITDARTVRLSDSVAPSTSRLATLRKFQSSVRKIQMRNRLMGFLTPQALGEGWGRRQLDLASKTRVVQMLLDHDEDEMLRCLLGADCEGQLDSEIWHLLSKGCMTANEFVERYADIAPHVGLRWERLESSQVEELTLAQRDEAAELAKRWKRLTAALTHASATSASSGAQGYGVEFTREQFSIFRVRDLEVESLLQVRDSKGAGCRYFRPHVARRPPEYARRLDEWILMEPPVGWMSSRAWSEWRPGPLAQVYARTREDISTVENTLSKVSNELKQAKEHFLDERLFSELLLGARSSHMHELYGEEEGCVKWADQMQFLSHDTFADGLEGRLKNLLGIASGEEVTFIRSIREEFRENDDGKWEKELEYVLKPIVEEEYRSTKGAAPDETMIDEYTRNLRHTLFQDGDQISIADGMVTHKVTGRAVEMLSRSPEEHERLHQTRRASKKLAMRSPQLDERVGAVITVVEATEGDDRVIARFRNPGMTLHDFWAKQPGRGTSNELSLAEIAVIRLYTGPLFRPWNKWLRGLDAGHGTRQRRPSMADLAADPPSAGHSDGDNSTATQIDPADKHPPKAKRVAVPLRQSHSGPLDDTPAMRRMKTWSPGDMPRSPTVSSLGESRPPDWRTSIAVLYQALIKLSVYTEPATVFRGVCEEPTVNGGWELPKSFDKASIDHEFAGGVEPAMLSTSKDPKTAIDYSGRPEARGTIFQISFDISNRGADLRWISQYPFERELLFPPGTSLTVMDEQKISPTKRVLHVKPGVSTHRPKTDWCRTVDTKPPPAGLRRPDKDDVGPLSPISLSLEVGTLDVREESLDYTLTLGSQVSARGGFKASGKLTQLRPITFDPDMRTKLGIPPAARRFAFAYPSPGQLEQEDDDGADQVGGTPRGGDGDSELKMWDSFLNGGGYVYFSEHSAQVLHAWGFREVDSLPLDDARECPRDLRARLGVDPPEDSASNTDSHSWARHMPTGISAVTLKSLKRRGVRKFAWLPPDSRACGGRRWQVSSNELGSQRPAMGRELKNVALAEALQSKLHGRDTVGAVEFDADEVNRLWSIAHPAEAELANSDTRAGPLLQQHFNRDDFVAVGTRYFHPVDLLWEHGAFAYFYEPGFQQFDCFFALASSTQEMENNALFEKQLSSGALSRMTRPSHQLRL